MKKNVLLLLLVSQVGNYCFAQLLTPRLNDVPGVTLQKPVAVASHQAQAAVPNTVQAAIPRTSTEAYVTNKASRQINFSYSTDGGDTWYSRTIPAGAVQSIPLNADGEASIKISTDGNFVRYRLKNRDYKIEWNTDKGLWDVFNL